MKKNKYINKQIYKILLNALLFIQTQSSDNPFYTGPNGEPREQEGKVWFEAFMEQELKKLKNKSTENTINLFLKSLTPQDPQNTEEAFEKYKMISDLF